MDHMTTDQQIRATALEAASRVVEGSLAAPAKDPGHASEKAQERVTQVTLRLAERFAQFIRTGNR